MSMPRRPSRVQEEAPKYYALRKIATMKAIRYRSLIRRWLAEGIRRKLRLGHP
jgi:hypothetical protein